jgi:hypothetical protein
VSILRSAVCKFLGSVSFDGVTGRWTAAPEAIDALEAAVRATPASEARYPRRITSPDDLLSELQSRPRDVYLSPPNGTWHLTSTRGVIVSESAVRELVERGVLVRTYSDCADCFNLGPTIDVQATLEARKKHGRHAPLVYVIEPGRVPKDTERFRLLTSKRPEMPDGCTSPLSLTTTRQLAADRRRTLAGKRRAQAPTE